MGEVPLNIGSERGLLLSINETLQLVSTKRDSKFLTDIKLSQGAKTRQFHLVVSLHDTNYLVLYGRNLVCQNCSDMISGFCLPS